MNAQVAPQVREPDLVIWLQAPPATLLQRLAAFDGKREFFNSHVEIPSS